MYRIVRDCMHLSCVKEKVMSHVLLPVNEAELA